MPRPPKPGSDKRSLVIRVRVTAAEKNTLQTLTEESGFNSLSDFMRVKSIGSVPKPKKATPERAVFIKALAELGKIGSNLNQIAKAVNRSQLISGVATQSILHKAIIIVEDLSDRLIRLLTHGS